MSGVERMARGPGLAARAIACGFLGLFAAGAAGASADEITLDRLGATRARPLFAPARRPPSAPIAPAPVPRAIVAAPPAPPPNVQLSGIIFGADKQVALMKRLQAPAAISVTVGGLVDGWTVSAILARSVILRRDDRSVTIGLPEPGR